MSKNLVFLFCLIHCSVGFAKKHILYSVEKDGKTSHILGTVHIVKAKVDDVHPLLPGLMSRARMALLEVNFATDRHVNFKVFVANVLKNNPITSKSEGLSIEAEKRLEAFFNKISKDHAYAKLWKFLPPGVVLLLVEALYKHINADPEQISVINNQDTFIDERISRLLKSLNKPIIPLDGEQRYEQALSKNIDVEGLSDYLLETLPEVKIQELGENEGKYKYVINGFKEALESKISRQALIEAYLNDDAGRVFSEVDQSNLKRFGHYDALLFGRNVTWTPKIIEELDKGSVLIVVGLAHLHMQRDWGKSLLQILEDNGYKVTALPKADYLLSLKNGLSCRAALQLK
jgi:uncharacterized protein YbaP (TraB family)